jgi:hypothetical protein
VPGPPRVENWLIKPVLVERVKYRVDAAAKLDVITHSHERTLAPPRAGRPGRKPAEDRQFPSAQTVPSPAATIYI